MRNCKVFLLSRIHYQYFHSENINVLCVLGCLLRLPFPMWLKILVIDSLNASRTFS